ncbi:MAG TPA: KH domain-containing protein [Synergistaceae bacterium]|nr:KH domain-containing protein [Synergistaceae bacterium]
MPDYCRLVEGIVKQLVTVSDAVSVTEERDSGTVRVKVSVDPQDLGRVIGRRGVTVNAIRTVVKAASMKSGERVEVDVVG